MNRQKRVETALETKCILESGEYEYFLPTNLPSSTHRKISIVNELKASCEDTILVDNNTTKQWFCEFNSGNKRSKRQNEYEYPKVSVVNQTTFAAAKELIMRRQELENRITTTAPPCCLNFASAKNAGGGFMRGAQAQEESLARASGLYSTLLKVPEYYETNRKYKNRGFYEDLLIYSPNVPVFRDDEDKLINDPWFTSIITMPAPNRGAIMKKDLSDDERNTLDSRIVETYKRRIDMVLCTAVKFGHRELVLGAWGCGVFQNHPTTVATLFKNTILDARFQGRFDSIVFAVLDHSANEDTYNAFKRPFIDFPVN